MVKINNKINKMKRHFFVPFILGHLTSIYPFIFYKYFWAPTLIKSHIVINNKSYRSLLRWSTRHRKDEVITTIKIIK